MQVKTQQLELDMEQQTGSISGKEYVKAVYCHPAYLTYMQGTSCEMLGWKHKLEPRLPGEISIPQIRRWHHPYGGKWRVTKDFLMKVKEESKKAGIKLNIQKTKIMASSPITSRQIDWETMETLTGFITFGSKITANDDCSHEVKRCLLFGRKVLTNLDAILKNRDISLPTKFCWVKALVFQVVMNGSESWAIKKAECWRNATFELWCWRRLLRVP